MIYSSGTREEHRSLVLSILNALADAGLYLDWKKSEFEAGSIKYLGFIIDVGKGIRADLEKV